MDDMAREFEFETGVQSDIGLVRAVNEDSVSVRPEIGVWLVADGMGGHAAGDFASQAIAGEMETLGIPASDEDLQGQFVERLSRANARILCHASKLGGSSVGSTVAALLIFQDRFSCVWSGDSRVYRLREGELRRVTKDHTEVQVLLDSGTITPEQARTWPRKNVITRAIGVEHTANYEVTNGVVRDDDLFLLCSDGLTEYFGDPEIGHVLGTEGADPAELCEAFIRGAVERGGKDNISVIVVRCRNASPPAFPIEGEFPEIGGAP